jgi:integrase
MKKEKLDIHNYESRFDTFKKQLEDLSENNKNIILEFDRYCFLREELSIARRCKLMNTLYNFVVQYLNKDLEKATIEDIEKSVEKIREREDYSIWTKQSYKSIVKKFYKWLKLLRNNKKAYQVPSKKYPPIVGWINSYVKKKKKPKLKESEILTEGDVAKLIEYSTHPRTRALVFMLYETGARIGEIGNLRVNDLVKTDYGYLVHLKGKTGERTPEIINAVPALTGWLEIHPLANDIKKGKNVPLWVNLNGKGAGKHMNYGSIRMLIKRLAKRAGLKKRIYQHLFRHSRVTHVLVNNLMSEQQCKKYFGWTPSSDQLDTYSHLQTKDANDAYKRSLGLIKEDENKKVDRFKLKECKICGEKNEYSNIYCKRCNNALDILTAQKDAVKRRETQERKLEYLVQKMIEQKAQLYFEEMVKKKNDYLGK